MDDISVLIKESQAGDKEARKILIESNLGLVHHIVKRFANRGHEMEDLFQVGTIGLMKAIDKFDLGFEVKFSTYAVPMIMGEIKRYLRDDGIIKVSRTLKENGLKVRMAIEKLTGKLGRDPTLSELSMETLLSVEEIALAMEAGAEVESIYKSVYQTDGSEVFLVDKMACQNAGGNGEHILSSGNPISMDYEKERLINHVVLKQIFDSLKEKERELIQMRYFQEKTQSEVAKQMGISQVQVSRLEKKILLQMREEMIV